MLAFSCVVSSSIAAALSLAHDNIKLLFFFHQEGIVRLPFGFYEPEINQSFLHYTRAQLRIVRMWWALRARGQEKGQEASSSLFSNGSACASSQCKRLMRWKMYKAFHRTFSNATHNIGLLLCALMSRTRIFVLCPPLTPSRNSFSPPEEWMCTKSVNF